MSNAPAKEPSFGDVIRRRRRELNLTQDEVAARIKTSTPYVGHLEVGKRHPSQKVVTKLAEVLGLDRRELFFLANPHAEALFSIQPETTEGSVSAWEQFRKTISCDASTTSRTTRWRCYRRWRCWGNFSRPRELIYILNTVRHAVGK